MSYTRINREVADVTFTVSWIEEEITLKPFGAMSRESVNDLVNNIQDTFIDELPIDLRDLIRDCTLDEFNEFLSTYSEASRDEEAEKEKMREQFSAITQTMMSSLREGVKGSTQQEEGKQK